MAETAASLESVSSVDADLVVWLSQFYEGAFYIYRKHPGTTLWGMRL